MANRADGVAVASMWAQWAIAAGIWAVAALAIEARIEVGRAMDAAERAARKAAAQIQADTARLNRDLERQSKEAAKRMREAGN